MNIPEELKKKKQWVLWKKEMRNGEETKPPFQPNGKYASTTNPETWSTYEDVKDVKGYEGAGFVFTDGDDYIGVDIDNCIGNKKEELAKEVVNKLNTYSEISPSGNGLHLICKSDKLFPSIKKEVEIYSTKRYFTMTGKPYSQPKEIRNCTQELEELVQQYTPKEAVGKETDLREKVPYGTLTDQEIIEKAMNSKNGYKFKSLWDGEDIGYNSPSEADEALCTMLAFWTQRDAARIESLFEQSNRTRKKWNRKDYRDRTINAAISHCNEVYTPQKREEEKEPNSFDAKELYEFQIPDAKWLIDKKILLNEMTLGVGYSGEKKTWIANDASISVASGKPFLNKYATLQGNVAYFDDESGHIILASRLQRYPQEQIPSDGSLTYYPYSGLDITNPEWIVWFEDLVKTRKIRLAVFDSFAGIIGATDQNTANEMRPLLSNLQRIAKENDMSILLIHHPRKSMSVKGKWKSKPDFLEEMRGSSELRNIADSIISIWVPDKVKNPEHVEIHDEKRRAVRIQDPIAVNVILDDENHTIKFEHAELADMSAIAAEKHCKELESFMKKGKVYTKNDLVSHLGVKDSTFYEVFAWGKENNILNKKGKNEYCLFEGGQLTLGGEDGE